MKKHSFKRIGMAALLLGGLVQVAQAHTIVSGLGASSRATDEWYLTCPSTTNHVAATVREILNPSDATQINLQIVSFHTVAGALNTTAPNTGGNAPWLGLVKGGGVYRVLVNKTGAGTETYNATVHCLNAQGVEVTAGEPVLIQNM